VYEIARIVPHDVVRAREQLGRDLLEQLATHRPRVLFKLRVRKVAHDAAELATRHHVELDAQEPTFANDRHKSGLYRPRPRLGLGRVRLT
jgi:hypothetical protein